MRSPTRALGIAVLIAGASACQSTGATAPDAASGELAGESEDAAKKEHALADKAHALSVAAKKLAVTELRLEGERMKVELELEAARQALALAERKRELFDQHERPKAIEEMKLAYDRARYSVEDDRAELSELEAMYAAEEFAEMTKELVLTRGRRNLETSERSLALRQKANAIRETELALESEKHAREVEKARRDLEGKQRGARLAQMKADVELLEARHGIGKLERELDELKKKAEE